MKVARLVHGGRRRYGVVEDDRIELFSGSPSVGRAHRTGETVATAEARLLAPSTPSKILAIGRNYRAHADEMGLTPGALPSVFLKPTTSLLDPGGDVVLPPAGLGLVEHEAEIALVIGRRARDIEPREALDHVFGITCADDVSARDLQRSDPHITRAKGFDTFCPLGPWIQTEFDWSDLAISCRVNGVLRQDGTSASCIFDFPTIISYLSSWTTLMPGDVVLTGSPGGTGPLEDGDQVEIEVGGVGVLRHGVRAARRRSRPTGS